MSEENQRQDNPETESNERITDDSVEETVADEPRTKKVGAGSVPPLPRSDELPTRVEHTDNPPEEEETEEENVSDDEDVSETS